MGKIHSLYLNLGDKFKHTCFRLKLRLAQICLARDGVGPGAFRARFGNGRDRHLTCEFKCAESEPEPGVFPGAARVKLDLGSSLA